MLHDFIYYTSNEMAKVHTQTEYGYFFMLLHCYYRYCIHKLGKQLFPSFVITSGTSTKAQLSYKSFSKDYLSIEAIKPHFQLKLTAQGTQDCC